MGTKRLAVGISTPTATLYLEVDEIGTYPDRNTSDVSCWLVCVASTNSSFYSWHDATVSASVNGVGFSIGGTDTDITQGGGERWRRGPYNITVPHDPNGSKLLGMSLSANYPHASGKGGSTSGQMWLSQLNVAPGAPSGLTAMRLSDSQVRLDWTRNEASNGQSSSFNIFWNFNQTSWGKAASIAPASTSTLGITGNRRYDFAVQAVNGVGASAWSNQATIWTTPAAPSSVAAAKGENQSITVTWRNNCAYEQYQSLIWHGVVVDGSVVWDASRLDTLASGVTSYQHTAPDTSEVHVYRVAAESTTGFLLSAWAQSKAVQLLAAPNSPQFAATPQYIDVAQPFTLSWVHNPVDTTAQTAFELQTSTDGGATWQGAGKTTDIVSSSTFTAGTWTVGQTVVFRVRTWGQATTGGADGTGVSPWSAIQTVRPVDAPTVTIQSPTGTVTQSTLVVVLHAEQAQGATPVSATLRLFDAGDLVETLTTTTLLSTTMATRLIDGQGYTLAVTVVDSHGLTSPEADVDFTVDYIDPVAALVDAMFLESTGMAQLNVTITDGDGTHADAVAISITRTIGGVTETVLPQTPVTESQITVLDQTPALGVVNTYTVTTWSVDGATVTTTIALPVDSGTWAYLTSGGVSIRFYANLSIGSKPVRESALVPTAGRARPIALYGPAATLDITVDTVLVDGEGSSVDAVEEFLLTAGQTCYRDPTGRRIFGRVQGSISGRTRYKAGLSVTVSEAQ